jgi:crotonobetainyl-CoA:carnitine CoA-transferase CaiB-like acyl-CoA transferase
VGGREFGDPRFTDAASRAKHDEELSALLEVAFASHPAAEWFTALDGAGVPCEVADADFPVDLFDDSDLAARRWVVSYPHPVVGHLQQAGHLVELSATPGLIERPAPIVGQHTRQLLVEHGYGSDEIDALLDAGVVAQA